MVLKISGTAKVVSSMDFASPIHYAAIEIGEKRLHLPRIVPNLLDVQTDDDATAQSLGSSTVYSKPMPCAIALSMRNL
jgi:hypothetical protein